MSGTGIPAAVLLEGIRAVYPFISRDKSRPVLRSMLIEVGPESVRLISADNYTIAAYAIATDASDLPAGRHLLRRADAALLAAMLKGQDGLAVLSIASGHLRAEVRGQSAEFTLAMGEYPNYAAVLPDGEAPETVALDPKRLAAIGKALALTGSVARISVSGALTPVLMECTDGLRIAVMPVRTTRSDVPS